MNDFKDIREDLAEEVEKHQPKVQYGALHYIGSLEKPPSEPWYAKAGEFLHEEVFRPLGAMTQAFVQPALGGGYISPQEAEEQYHELPWYQQLALEAPWFAASATAPFKAGAWALGGTRAAKPFEWAARGVGRAERMAAAPITAPLKGVGYVARGGARGAVRRVAKAWDYPPIEELRKLVFKPTRGRAIGERLARTPVIGAPVRRVDPRLAFQDEVSQIGFMKTAISERLASQKLPNIARVRALGDEAKIFAVELDEAGNSWMTVRGKRMSLGDVHQFRKAQKLPLTSEQKLYLDTIDETLQPLRQKAKELGVKWQEIEGEHLHRRVIGHKDVGLFERLRGARTGVVKGMERERAFKTEAEGIVGGYIYEPSLARRLEFTIDAFIDRISRAEMANALKKYGVTPTERMPSVLKENLEAVRATRNATGHFHRSAVDASAGKRLSAQTLRKIEAEFPEQAERLRVAMEAGDRTGLKAIQKEVKVLATQSQTEVNAVQREYTSALKRARRATVGTPDDMWKKGWYPVDVPELSGHFFKADVAQSINKVLGRRPEIRPLTKLQHVAQFTRAMVASLDMSVIFIQGLYTLGRRPDIWARSTVQALKVLVEPKNFERWIAKHYDSILERVQHGGSSQIFEMYEAGAPLRKVPLVGIFYRRAEAFFGGWGEIARDGMWQAWKGSAAKQGELEALARSIDRMTGVTSTRAMGVGTTQSAVETLLLFAPRYTRANLALMTDMFKGGYTARMAMRSIGQTAMGGMAFYIGVCEAIGQKPFLDPTKASFMTLDVDGNHYGVGGVMYGLVRMGAAITADIKADNEWDSPLDLVKPSLRDNPIINFWRARTSTVTGTFMGLMEGKDFLGEPLETTLDYASYLGEQLAVPIAMQAFVEREGEPSVGRVGAEFGGLRTYPVTVFERRNELQDRYAGEAGFTFPDGRPKEAWTDLEQDEKAKVLAAHPDLEEARKEAEEARVRRGGAKEQQWAGYKSGTEFIKDEWIRQAEMYSQELAANRISGNQFRNLIGDISAGRQEQHELMHQQYPDIDLGDPSTIDEDKRFDVALNEYFNDLFGDKTLETPQGFDYDEYNRRKEQWITKWGDAIYQRVREHLERDAPAMVKELYRAREILRPYWEIRRELVRRAGLQGLADYLQQLELTDPMKAKLIKQNTPQGQQLAQIEKQAGQIRQAMLMTNPQMAQYYYKFYSEQAPLGAEQRVATLAR